MRPELKNSTMACPTSDIGCRRRVYQRPLEDTSDATKRDWQSDTHRTNRLVQVTRATPIRGARLRRHDVPSDAANFLVDNGNLLNKIYTPTNNLETWRSTRTVEAASQRKKDAEVDAQQSRCHKFHQSRVRGRERSLQGQMEY